MSRCQSFSLLAAVLFAVLWLASDARADRFVLRDGSTIEADIVNEDERSVTVEEWAKGGATGVVLSRRIEKSQVQTWYRAPREGPAYVVIPVFGAIGEDVTAASLRAGLGEARSARPRYVVLAIDSPGGSIREMFAILDALWERHDEFEIIAYAKNAYSAAAVIAMSCERVYIKPGGAIGAAVPFRITENGPADVEAKFRSVIEAGMRAANAHGGHADLLMRGMGELDLEIYLGDDHGRPQLSCTGPGKLIKSRGQILTLTADEASACGLAAVAGDLGEIGRQLVGGPWHEASRRPWRALVNAASSQKRLAREQEEKRQLAAARQAALERIQPEMEAMAQRIIALDAKSASLKKSLADLTAKANLAMKQVQADYDDAIRRAGADVNPRAARKRAQDAANARAAEIDKSYQQSTSRAQADLDAATLEASALRQRQQQLLATVPDAR